MKQNNYTGRIIKKSRCYKILEYIHYSESASVPHSDVHLFSNRKLKNNQFLALSWSQASGPPPSVYRSISRMKEASELHFCLMECSFNVDVNRYLYFFISATVLKY